MINGETHNQEEINKTENCEPQTNQNHVQEEQAGDYSLISENSLLTGVLPDIPFSDRSLYVSKIFDIFERLAAPNCDENTKAEAAQNIQERLEKAAQMIDEFQNKNVPEGAEDMHTDILVGFDLFYNGLDLFAKYIEFGDTDLAIEALRTIYVGDTVMQKVQEEIAMAENTTSIGILL